MSPHRTVTLAPTVAARRRRTVLSRAPRITAPPAPEPLRLFTVVQAAELLGIGRTTVYELVWSGRLTPLRIGRTVRFTRDQLEAFIADLGAHR